jgi:hypothetical protein
MPLFLNPARCTHLHPARCFVDYVFGGLVPIPSDDVGSLILLHFLDSFERNERIVAFAAEAVSSSDSPALTGTAVGGTAFADTTAIGSARAPSGDGFAEMMPAGLSEPLGYRTHAPSSIPCQAFSSVSPG